MTDIFLNILIVIIVALIIHERLTTKPKNTRKKTKRSDKLHTHMDGYMYTRNTARNPKTEWTAKSIDVS